MADKYRETDIIAWVQSLRVNDAIGVYNGPDLHYTTYVSEISKTGQIVSSHGHTYLENGDLLSEIGVKNYCIRPLKDATRQIAHLRILDFTGANGILVKKSEYMSDELGIMVETEIRFDTIGKGIAWPMVIWEGSVKPEVLHPTSIVPCRSHDLKWIELSTSKPVSV